MIVCILWNIFYKMIPSKSKKPVSLYNLFNWLQNFRVNYTFHVQKFVDLFYLLGYIKTSAIIYNQRDSFKMKIDHLVLLIHYIVRKNGVCQRRFY